MAEPRGETMRLDCYLWWTRWTKTRSQAQQIAESGRLRIDGRPVERKHAGVRVGNILTFALRGHVHVIRVEALPVRRGPPAEARCCFSELTIDGDGLAKTGRGPHVD